jgi:periplasmic protein CpxP/Spy
MKLQKQISRMKLTLAVAVLAALGSATMGAQAPAATPGAPGQDPGAPGMGPHRPPMERAMRGEHARWWNNPQTAEKYKLSDSQRKSMDDIYQQHRVTLVDLHGTLEKAELAMEPMMRADQPDESKILAQIDQVAQARAELEKANARMLFEIRRQLTPEQWKQIQADRAAHQEHGPGQHGPGPMGHEGGPRWHGQPPAGGAPATPPPGENE